MSESNQQVAVATPTSTAVVNQNKLANRFSPEELQQTDLNHGAMIPDTTQATPLPVKLNEENWSPEVGEVKDFVVIGISEKPFPSMDANKQGQTEMVKTVSLASLGADKSGNPKIERWSISAKRAVSTIEDAVNRGFVILGNAKTMVRLTYTGDVKNKTNAFKSRNFDVEVIINN